MRSASKYTKRRTALVLAIGLIAAVVLTAFTIGLGKPSIPEGAVAIVETVEDGDVSDAAFDRAMEQTAARVGLDEVPPRDDPQWEGIRDQAVEGLILEKWVEGELSERGIEITDADVESELESVREGFENQKQFERAVRQSEFCTEEEIDSETPAIECEDVRNQGRLIAAQRALVEEFQTEPEVSDSEIEDFYEANIESFEQPETRDVRQIVNEDRAEVEQAAELLEGLGPDDEDFLKRWRQAAEMFSQDQASKDGGGLIRGLVEGQGDPEVDEMVFNASQGELIGPFKSERGFNLIQVVDVKEAGTQSLDEASDAIRQQLVTIRGQSLQQQVQEEFAEKWRSRTFCEPIALVPSCDNFVEPDPPPLPGGEEVDTGPAVQSSAPIEPGTATFSADGSPQTGLPQRPRQIGDPCAPEGATPDPCGPDELSEPDPAAEGALPGGLPEGLPPGAVPVGPGGAGAPPGAGGAPPGAGGVPPGAGGAPPGAGGAAPGGP